MLIMPKRREPMARAETSNHRRSEHAMYKNIEEISGKKTCSSTGYLKSKKGVIIFFLKIRDRWAEYLSELF